MLNSPSKIGSEQVFLLHILLHSMYNLTLVNNFFAAASYKGPLMP